MRSASVLAGLAGLALAAPPARAESPPPPAERPALPERAPRGLALGVELGDPTSATAGWFTGPLSITGALGTGTLAGVGLSLHADVQYVVHRLAPGLPVRLGLGGRYYHHGYQAMATDEIPDTHLGVRLSAGIALERSAFQLYAELAPGIDVVRTRSCTFASGADTICPHAQEPPLYVQLAVGARWFLSH